MTFQTDCNDVRQILHYFEERLCENEAADDIRMDFNQLICLLDSPLFARLANVEDALTTLSDISRIHAITETDFDIDVDSGEIRFSNRHSKKLNNQGLQQHVGSDNYHEEKQNNNQVRKKHMIPQHPGEGEIELIELQKPEGQGIGLGFGIVGLSSVTQELGVIVHEIQPGSIAARDGRLRENDKILAINGQALNETAPLSQAVQLLQAVTGKVALIVAHETRPELEQSISVTEQSMAMSPLSVASESIFSCDYIQLEVIDLYNDGSGLGFGIISGRGCGVLIKTIVPNGISDKDGRLRSGDRILMIGDVDVRNMNTEGVATELRQSSVHVRLVVARNLGSLPPPAPHGGNNDTLKVTVLASQLDEELEKLKRKAVAAAEEDSQVASEKGDDLDTLPQISSLTMPSDVLPEVDVFEVELTKDQSGLGITIAGYNDPNDGVPHIFVNEIADGSVAALDGRIRLFDRIIQVDGHALKGCDNQKALDVFRKTGQVVHLKIARPKIGAHFEPVSRRSVVSDSRPTSRVESVYMNTNSDAPPDDARGSADDDAVAYWQSVFGPGYQIIVANLVKPKPSIQLGISLEGIIDKETGVVHHIVRSILPDGVVGSSGLILSDDELVEVNGIKLYGLSHSEIVHVLRELPAEVCLIVARGTQTSVASEYFSVEQSVTSQLSSTPPVAPPPVDINRTKHTVATPIIDRLVKAKSEQALFNPSPAVTPLNQNRSKSLDSLAMFGLWSSDPVEVELEKGDQGLGFSILDYPDTLDPNKTMIIVRGLVPDGTAYRDGRLQPGDRLVSVNDISLFNASLDMAVQSLVGAPKGIIRLTVLKQERFGSSNTDVDQEMTSWSSPAEEVTSSPDRVNDTRQSVKQHAITVTGSSGKLGVTVESLLDKGQRGCVVTSLDPDGRLAQDGQLAVGDVILSINKDDVRDVSSVQARAILRRLSLIGTSDLTIVFTRNESNQIESRTPDLLSQVLVKDQNNEDSFKSNTQQSPSVLSPLSLPLLSVADPDDQFSAGVKSAMSSISNWGPSHVVEIFRKEGESLGISIVGGHIKQLPGSAGESGKVFSGIFIKHIRPDSPAGRNGIIQTGDHILEVNGVDLRDVTHDQAVDAIRNAASPIRFLVRSLVSVPGMTVEPEAIPVATHPSALKKALPVTGSTSSDGSDEYDDDDDPGLQQQLSPLPDLHSDDEQHASDLSTLKLPRLSPVDDGYLAAGRISPSHGTTTESVETESLDNVAVFSLTKGDRGFGFAIEELPLKDGSRGIFVKTISPDGPAAEEGTLSVGDRLLKVDDVSLHHATYSEALLALRQFNFGSAARLTVNKASLDGSDLHDTSSLGSDNGSTPAASSVSPSHRMPAVTLTPADDKPTISTPAEVAAAAVADDPATREIVPGRETTIEIQKGKTGLGLSIIGGSDTLLGAIVVHEVYENGAAARDGRLWAGDQILEVCGESLRSTTHERAIQILRQTPSVVKLVVLREVEVLSDGEMYETISVDLVKKRNAGLGFSIVNRPSGVFISDLVRGGVAESDGRLMPGDHIISLNGTDVTDATQEQIAEFLRTSTGVVSIAVRRLKPGKDGPTSIAGVNYQSSSSSRNGLDLPMALHEKAKSGSSAASSSSPPADQKAGDDDVSTIAVELSRHERGLLMLKLAPEQTATGSPSKGHLIIVDLHGTGKAIGDKLQVYDKILSINGHSTRGMSERDACQLIQASGDSVVMIIVRGQQTFSSSTTAATKSASGVSVDEPDDASQYSESVRRITIRRGAHGFGFSIVGGRDEKMGNIPIYIKQVFPGGPADVDGRLKRGDQLLTVNGKSLEGFTHEQAVEALKNASVFKDDEDDDLGAS